MEGPFDRSFNPHSLGGVNADRLVPASGCWADCLTRIGSPPPSAMLPEGGAELTAVPISGTGGQWTSVQSEATYCPLSSHAASLLDLP